LRFFLGSFCLLLLWCSRADARVFRVGRSDDGVEATSLRGAILEANRRGGYNIVMLTGREYALTITGAYEDAARTGDLDITRGTLMILAAGEMATIDATKLGERVFQVHRGARLVLWGICLTGGRAPGGAYGSWAHLDGEPGGRFTTPVSLL